MSVIKKTSIAISVFISLSLPVMANSFSLMSHDIKAGEFMSKVHEYKGFGCDGEDRSPQFSWSNPPAGTKAFALFAYDPDAPTGSGWWHWQLINIPKGVREIAAGAGNVNNELLPRGSVQIENDYGSKSFGGACPPEGHGVHRYQFTLYALSQELQLPENPSSALVGYMVKAHALGSSQLEALYQRH